MNNSLLIFILLIISSVAVKAAPSCVTNGRFADPSDPCGQTYVVCLWNGAQFLTWTLKCPPRLVFHQPTSKCGLPTSPVPSGCPAATTTTTTTTTPMTTTSDSPIAARPSTPTCTMNGNFADPSDTCNQAYVLCSWDGTKFLSFSLKCPGGLVFNQMVLECVQPATPLPASCLSTDVSITSTAPPITSTAPSITSTAPPITSTAPPITSTAPPITSTAPPITSTAPPVTSTDPPITSSSAPPVTSTDPPITSSSAPPITSTAPPITSTAPPTTSSGKPTCKMNGRFADPSDPCGQSYVLCSWDGSKFLMWEQKCPNQLVFLQATSKCVRSATPLPATC